MKIILCFIWKDQCFTYVIRVSETAISSINWLSRPRTAWRLCSCWLIETDFLCRYNISLLMLPKSDWKLISIDSILCKISVNLKTEHQKTVLYKVHSHVCLIHKHTQHGFVSWTLLSTGITYSSARPAPHSTSDSVFTKTSTPITFTHAYTFMYAYSNVSTVWQNGINPFVCTRF